MTRRLAWPLRLIVSLVDPRHREVFVGDLVEERLRYVEPKHGALVARIWFVKEIVVGSLVGGWHRVRGVRRHSVSRARDARIDASGHSLSRWLDGFRQDARHSWRRLLASPLFLAVALGSLALGIGANTAIFSVMHALLFSPLPYPDAERLLRIYERDVNEGREFGQLSTADFVDHRERQRSLTDIAAFTWENVTHAGGPHPELLDGLQITPTFMNVLGVPAMLGRPIVESDLAPDAEPVVVLSREFWRGRFGADPGVLGTRMLLDQTSRTIVGVMPADYGVLFENPDVYYPLEVRPILDDQNRRRRFHWLQALGRVRPDASTSEAFADLSNIARQLEQEYPDDNTGHLVTVRPLREAMVGDAKRTFMILLGAVGLILIMTCVNVANVILSKAVSRERETAVRAALGAGFGRLVRQVLTENLILSVAGGMVGLVVAYAGVRGLVALFPNDVPLITRAGLHLPVLLFASVASVLTGVALGLVPAFVAANTDLNLSLGSGRGGASVTVARSRVRSAFIVIQSALAVTLLIGAGLVVRSLIHLSRIEAGFEARQVLTLRTSVPFSKAGTFAERAAYFERYRSRIEALPGVETVGIVSALPLLGGATASLVIEGRPVGSGPPPEVGFFSTTPTYFEALRIPLLSGRLMNDADDLTAPGVIVINDAMARAYWPGEDPLGRRVRLGPNPEAPWTEIVGIVGDVRHYGLDEAVRPSVFLPLGQSPFWRSVQFVVRTTSDPAGFVTSIREAGLEVDSSQPLYAFAPMTDVISGWFAGRRFLVSLLTMFGVVALFLAALGVFGVVSYSVAQRTHELGVRLALGARHRDVIWRVVLRGMLLAGLGVAAGVAVALAFGSVTASVLYEVGARDPVTFVAAPMLVITVSLVASYLPARRVTKVDPVRALRAE